MAGQPRAAGPGHDGRLQPSITALPDGDFQVAIQANTSHLWVVKSTGVGEDWNLAMMAGTSPSITAQLHGGVRAAIQSYDGRLWTADGPHLGDFVNTEMTAGTSPAITSNWRLPS